VESDATAVFFNGDEKEGVLERSKCCHSQQVGGVCGSVGPDAMARDVGDCFDLWEVGGFWHVVSYVGGPAGECE